MAEVGYLYVFPAQAVEGFFEVYLRLLLAMDDKELFEFLLVLTAYVVDHLAVVAVTGERFDAAQFGTNFIPVAKDRYRLVTSHYLGPKGGGFAVTHAENGGGGVVDVVGQMVLDAAGFHHTRCRNNDAGFVAHVESLGGLYRLDILQTVEPEGVGVVLHVFQN